MQLINPTKNKARFEELVKKYVKREGVESLLKWLESTDFYTAPASTQYHLSVEGGLCQHSLNVFDNLVMLSRSYYKVSEDEENPIFNGATIEDEGAYSMENIVVTALFHDICKANCYVRDFRNVKIDGKWNQVEYWRWDEQFIYGHGTKSVYIIQQFMRLYIAEAHAIRYHMAGKEDTLSNTLERGSAQVYEKTPIAVMLHLADMMSAYLTEAREGNNVYIETV